MIKLESDENEKLYLHLFSICFGKIFLVLLLSMYEMTFVCVTITRWLVNSSQIKNDKPVMTEGLKNVLQLKQFK